MSSLRNIVLGCVSERGQETPEPDSDRSPKRMAKYVFYTKLLALAYFCVNLEFLERLLNRFVF